MTAGRRRQKSRHACHTGAVECLFSVAAAISETRSARRAKGSWGTAWPASERMNCEEPSSPTDLVVMCVQLLVVVSERQRSVFSTLKGSPMIESIESIDTQSLSA